jgi:hypothetical protein
MNKMDTMDLEADRESSKAAAVHQEVPIEEATVKTVRGQEDQSRDQQPTVGYRNPRKSRTKVDVVQGTLKGQTVEKR